jgi:hypothetical protein
LFIERQTWIEEFESVEEREIKVLMVECRGVGGERGDKGRVESARE